MAEGPSSRGWIDLDPEVAKEHPLYGVRGWLAALIPLLAGLVVFSYYIQIFARPGLDGLPPAIPPSPFIPDVQSLAAFFLILAILMKSRLVSYIAVLGFPVLTAAVGLYIAGSEFLLASGEAAAMPPMVASGFETGLEAAVVLALRDLPIALYFVLSRRVMVTCYHQVRGRDPFAQERLAAQQLRLGPKRASPASDGLSLGPRPEDDAAVNTGGHVYRQRQAQNKNGGHNDNVHSDGIRRPEREEPRDRPRQRAVYDEGRRWAAYEVDQEPRAEAEPETVLANSATLQEGPNAADPSAEQHRPGHMTVLDDPRWDILEKYDADVVANFETLADLGSEWQAHYAERCIELHPETRDAAKIAGEIRDAHDRYWHLSDDPAINRFYRAAYRISPEAAEAFKRVYVILGDKMNAHKVFKDLEVEFTIADKDLWGFEDREEVYFVGEFGYRSLGKAIFGARAHFADKCDGLPAHMKIACMRVLGKPHARVAVGEISFSEDGKTHTVQLASFGEFLLADGNNNQIRQIRSEFLG